MNFISIKDCPKNQIDFFTCGNGELDEYFKRYALQNDKRNLGKTFVLFDDSIIGFYTLSNAQISFEEIDFSLNKNLPKYPIPCIRIARLAVSKEKQGRGFGKLLLKDALDKILLISKNTGVYFILVDAKVTACSFYERFGFQPINQNSQTMVLTLKTLEKASFC